MAVTVRPATRTDLRAVEAVRIATWKAAYRGLLPDRLLDALSVTAERVAGWERSFEAGGPELIVACAGEQLVGFASAGPCRDEDRPAARELWGLYVLPAHWGTGAGAALMTAVGEIDVVWVLEGNSRAISFYERHGFGPDGTVQVLKRLGGARELRYARLV